MLIDLFSNLDLINKNSKLIARLRARDFNTTEDLSYYENMNSETPDEEYHVSKILKALELPKREYFEKFGEWIDSHYEIFKLGIDIYAKPHTIIVSMEDSLDYLLHCKTGVDPLKIRSIENYYNVSRYFLKPNLFEKEIKLNLLFGIAPELDTYLLDLFERCTEDDEEDTLVYSYVKTFLKELVSEATKIAEYIGIEIIDSLPEKTCSMRSQGLSGCVLSSALEVEPTKIQIVGRSGYKYEMNIRSFKRKEFADCLEYRFS